MSESGYPKEYRLRIYWLLLMMWVGGLIAVIWSLVSLGNLILRRPEYWFIVVIIPIQIYVLIFLFYFVKDFRLHISESGINFIVWSRTISAKWSQVKSLDRAYFQNQLVLDSPRVEKRKDWRFFPDFLGFRSNASFRSLPFSKNTWERYSEIESEVRNMRHVYFPKSWVFVKGANQANCHRSEEKRGKTKVPSSLPRRAQEVCFRKHRFRFA